MRERVIKVLAEINPKVMDSLDENLLEEGVISSFEIVNLVMDLENEFDVEILPEDISPAYFCTISAIVSLIEKSAKNA